MVEQLVRQSFAVQAEVCEALGSPFTASLCRCLGENLDRELAVARLCLDWEGDPGSSADSIPLRLCGGLHALVLNGRGGELTFQYPPHSQTVSRWSVIRETLEQQEAFLLDWMQSPPQTNEVSRSGVIWPALMTLSNHVGCPLNLLEVGASGGLNLNCDRFRYRLGDIETGWPDGKPYLNPEWKGAQPVDAAVEICGKRGCDINPLDTREEYNRLRLRSYVWPDQADRKKRLDEALSVISKHPVSVDRMDAVAWLESVLADPKPGQCNTVYSTIAWQYLPSEARARGEEIIRQAGGRARDDAPLAWIRFEADGQTPGAGVRLQIWPQGLDVQLGRADFHGRWIEWGEMDANQSSVV